MTSLRTPFFVVAVVLIALAVLIELGSGLILGGTGAGAAMGAQAGDLGVDIGSTSGIEAPPGRAISYLALVDGILLYTVLLIGASLVVPEKALGRAQGPLTLVGSILLVVVGLVLGFIAFVELTVMVALFFAVPFGTVAYLALWGFFPRGDAAIILSLLMFLKLASAVFLILAQQRFLQQKGLVLLVITSLVCNVVVAFLHGLVPGVLVSVLDDLAAIVIAVIAVVWGIVLLVGSIPSIVATIRAGAGTR